MFERRGFLKALGFGVAAAASSSIKKRVEAADEAIQSSQFLDCDQSVDPQPPKIMTFPESGTITGILPEQSLRDMISQGGSGTLDIVWGPDLDFDHQLKADRAIYRSDCSFFMQESASQGCVVSIDQNEKQHEVVKKQIGKEQPVGVLLNDVVDIDTQHFRAAYNAVYRGGKVSICTDGQLIVTTDGNPKPGDIAFSCNGVINNQDGVPVGVFLSGKDEDGFSKVKISI